MKESTLAHSVLSARIGNAALPEGMHTAVVGVDGCGGAGKSTFAERLAALLSDCPIVHTDDFASADNPLDWYGRMLEEVFIPLRAGESVRYQRYDWSTSALGAWQEVPQHRFLIVEGVSATRREFRPYLAYRIFIETDRDTRLARGLERDGAQAKDQWLGWMQEEDDYLARDNPRVGADLVISGNPASSYDPTKESVVLTPSSRH